MLDQRCVRSAMTRQSFVHNEIKAGNPAYLAVLGDITHIIEEADYEMGLDVKSVMTITSWAIGARIIEWEETVQGTQEGGNFSVKDLIRQLWL